MFNGSFPKEGGQKRGNSTLTASTVTAIRKGVPRYYVERAKDMFIIFNFIDIHNTYVYIYIYILEY